MKTNLHATWSKTFIRILSTPPHLIWTDTHIPPLAVIILALVAGLSPHTLTTSKPTTNLKCTFLPRIDNRVLLNGHGLIIFKTYRFLHLSNCSWLDGVPLSGWEVGGQIAIVTATNEAEDGWAGSRSLVCWADSQCWCRSIQHHGALGKLYWTGRKFGSGHSVTK